MFKSDLISVIMAAYNEELGWVRESIDSILNQTYKNFEFIIVLDNPGYIELKELLLAYAERDSRIKLLINEENLGLVKSLNIALEHCKGEYIARMDADDISEEKRLELQKKYLEANDLDFAFSEETSIDGNGDPIYKGICTEINHGKVKKLLRFRNCAPHPSWFVKAEAFKDLNGYRDVPHCEDYDLLLRAIYKGYKIGGMPESIVRCRTRSTSVSSSNGLEQFLNDRGIRKLYRRSELGNIELVEDMVHQSKNSLKEISEENFNRARNKMGKAVAFWKNNNKLRSIYCLTSSCFEYKLYVIVYINLLRFKIGRKFYA